jgi:hypothetical protein
LGDFLGSLDFYTFRIEALLFFLSEIHISCIIWAIFLFLWDWSLNSGLLWQVLYHLSHAHSPFFFLALVIFEIGSRAFAQAVSLLPLPPVSQACATMSGLLTEMGVSLTFSPGWPWTSILPSAWDYRYKSPRMARVDHF